MVRHGQASFLAENYDKLSATGWAQSRRLGEYWARLGVRFDRVYRGPCVRHAETLAGIREGLERAGVEMPEAVTLAEFDEYAGDAVLKAGLAEMLGRDVRVRELHAVFGAAEGERERRRSFQRVFEAVVTEWARGRLACAGVESWAEFRARVNVGLERVLTDGAAGERVALVTSGGPIAVAAARALELSGGKTLELSWMSWNCSWSEFLYSGERFTLSGFNAHGHLESASMLTHR